MPVDSRHRRPAALLLGILSPAIALALVWLAAAGAVAEPPRSTDVDVPALIEQLGHRSYAARVRARDTLERLGLQAFDDLHAAQFHADSEIAMTARYLVSSLLVSWSTEADPPAVREALNEYGAQSETERKARIDRLAELPDRQGLPALVRLARFETSLRLSREAALAVMRVPMNDNPAARAGEADMVLEVLGYNERQAAQWLRAYAEDLRDGEYSAAKWQQLVQQQRATLGDAAGDAAKADPERPALLELVRVCATRAVAAGHRDEALQLVSDHLDLIPERSREVIDACGWAIDNGLHALVMQLQAHYPDLFARQPILLYGAAEATLVAGDGEAAAEELATRAAAIDPLPRHDSDEAAELSPKAFEELAQRHRETGRELESRGLFRWAEREYRHIVDAAPVEAPISAIARAQLAAMLGELLRYQDGVEILRPMIQRAEADQQYARRLQSQHINVNRIKSMMLHYQGMAQMQAGDDASLEAARKSLSDALELDAVNVDILIAMYRLDGDEAWRESVRRRIRSIASMFDNQIEALRQQTQRRARFPDVSYQLAEFYNQYAWLISNTEGDKRKALQYSLRSLELVPDEPAQLDTAGRCYFALDDLENALRVQRRAVKLMPHSPPLVRQLAEFEAAQLAAEPAGDEATGDEALADPPAPPLDPT